MNSMTSQNKKAEKALVSKFITQLFEKNYSTANKTLETLIEKKLKTKIKKMHDECSCEKHGKSKKKDKKEKELKENVENFLDDSELSENSTESEIEMVQQQPEDGDIVLSNSGQMGSRTDVSEVNGERLGTFASEQDAEQFVKKYMDQKRFYPNVWVNDDHGGYTLRKIQ